MIIAVITAGRPHVVKHTSVSHRRNGENTKRIVSRPRTPRRYDDGHFVYVLQDDEKYCPSMHKEVYYKGKLIAGYPFICTVYLFV